MERIHKKRKGGTATSVTETALNYLLIIPKDVLIFKIMERLDVTSLMSLRKTSLKMKTLTKDCRLWMKWFKRDFEKYDRKGNWEERCINLWNIESEIKNHNGLLWELQENIFWRGLTNKNLDTVQNIMEREMCSHKENTHVDSKFSPLTYVCKEGNIEIVKYFLTVSVAVDCLDMGGCTPFARACESGQLEVVKLLLEHETETAAQVGSVPWEIQNSGLILATKAKHHKIVEHLLKHVGPGQNELDGALIASAEVGDLFLANILIESGAHIQTTTFDGKTSLYVATYHEHSEIVRLLLEKGATVVRVLRKAYGLLYNVYNPIVVAVEKNNLEIAECLLQYGFGTELTECAKNRTILMIACFVGNLDMVKLVLRYGAKIESTDRVEETPLLIATKERKIDIVEYLLKNGARVDAKDADGETPLVVAVEHNWLDIAEVLLKNSADVEGSHGENQQTPLLIATLYKHEEMAKLLLKYGADIEARNVLNMTSLLLGSYYKSVRMVEILLERGCDTEAADDKDWTSMHYAASNGNSEIMTLLLLHGANVNPRGEIQYAYAKGEKYAAKCYNGYSPLIVASEQGHAKIVELLLHMGADINARDGQNFSALSWAMSRKHTRVVKLLQDRISEKDLTVVEFKLHVLRNKTIK